jgi:oligopeptidase B
MKTVTRCGRARCPQRAGSLLMLLLSSLPAASETPPQPPVAKVIPHVSTLHGQKRMDNYFWLREKTNPAVRAYLDAENVYTDAVMKPTEQFQETLYNEIISHIKETDLDVPYRMGGWFYYSRTEKGKQYRIQCRKKGTLEAAEEVLLDLNELSRGQTYFSLGGYDVSDDGHLLAYSTDVTGFREYTLEVKDLRTSQLLPERLERIASMEWAADNRTFFYTTEDHAKRSYRLYRHQLKTPVTQDELVYEEKDERFNVFVNRSRSKAFLFSGSRSHTASEVRFLPADQPAGEWRLISARAADHEYDVDHHDDSFFIRSNLRGRNFALFKAPVSNPASEHWQEVVPHRTDVMLEEVNCFRDHYVLSEREGGLPQLRITAIRSGESHRVKFPEPTYAVHATSNHEFDTSILRYGYQSLVTPDSTYDYDMQSRGVKLLKRVEVPGGFDRANYESERIHAIAKDGTHIPVSLVYRKGLKRGGRAPLLLAGYGSYGSPMSVYFQSSRLCLLDRGFVCAFAHIRGGGDLGKPWHDAGRMMNKKNTFTDFIAVAEHLAAEKYTSNDRLIIAGGSAGGLLMGAVVNLRPDLFKAVVSHVPFVDVINSMSDESLPLTVAEFEEWGNPKVKAEYDYMNSYCPYTNLKPAAYPAMLVKTSFNDPAVMYWEPAKYVAKLRALKQDRNPLLLKVNMSGSHGGASGRYDRYREIAFDHAFVLTQLGITK